MSTDYFKNLLDLLKIEREEDLRSYEEQTLSSSIPARRDAGLTWYPVAIRGTEISRGDYLVVELERTSHHDASHQFRFGSSAVLFSNHDPKNNRAEGTISYQGGDRIKITLKADELPDWSREGKLGLDLLFDENSYQEMNKALKEASKLTESKEGELVRILSSSQKPEFDNELSFQACSNLNSSQQLAVRKILSARHLAIVHGPPGTGKTTTLVQAIRALIMQGEKQVLVSAPSNAAVDLLSKKLYEEGLNVLRIGHPARISDRLMSLTLDGRISMHSSAKELKKLRKQAAEYKNMAHKYKRNFGRAEQEQRRALFSEVHKLMAEVNNMEKDILDDLIGKAQVITTTLVGAGHYTIKNLNYEVVVIDEAGQALEPACWIPLLKAKKVVLAGDHCQLPPTIKSKEAAINGLAATLFEKAIVKHPEAVVLLEEQYRMHEKIMSYSSEVFYEDKLKAHSSVAGHLLFPEDAPLVFIDTAGSGFDEKSEGTSVVNPEEASFLVRHLCQLVEDLASYYRPEDFPTIGVISPYKQQVQALRELLDSSPELQLLRDKISVNTIDSFQGQERDIIYISMVRANGEARIGFLSDIRRLNVAMTRARKKLVLVGDSATLGTLPFYANFIGHAERLNAYQSVWEFAE